MLARRTLSQRLVGKPLERPELSGLATQIADAPQAAHAKKIIHRDVEPPKMFVTEAGQAKILDFGLADAVRGRRDARSAQRTSTSPLGSITHLHEHQG